MNPKESTLPSEQLTGHEYHVQALEANEKGDFLFSLENSDRAMLSYQKEGDVSNFAEILAMRSLTLRRLAKETGDQNFLIASKHEIEAGVEVARKSNDSSSLSIPLYNLFKVQVQLGEHENAVNSIEEALRYLPESPQNRKSVELDMRANLETAKLRMGDQEAEVRAQSAITEIENAVDANEHKKGVWVAGGYMRLAEAVFSKNPQKAQEYLQKAQQIIDKNPEDLKLVKKDLEELSSRLK